ncbi:MAG: NfeD family protein [Agathobacter sp.]|nr:NfeD family protein [Agathobacter sp.]
MIPVVIVWLVMVIVFVIAELATVGLLSIWFAAGALVAMIIAIFGGPVPLQLAAFFIVSIILLIATKSWAQKYINSRTTKTNVDSLIGKRTVITQRVSNLDQTGKTVLSGQEWTVRSDDDSVTFEEGELVEVVRISGVKLIVKKV